MMSATMDMTVARRFVGSATMAKVSPLEAPLTCHVLVVRQQKAEAVDLHGRDQPSVGYALPDGLESMRIKTGLPKGGYQLSRNALVDNNPQAALDPARVSEVSCRTRTTSSRSRVSY